MSASQNGGIYSITLAAGEDVTLELPKGAISFYASAATGVSVYAGRTTNGQSFQIVTEAGKTFATIEGFQGGLYTFKEPTGGAPVTIQIWAQGLGVST